MTAISLRDANWSRKTARTGGITGGQLFRDNTRSIGLAQLREQLPRFGGLRSQEVAGGFVDFLLGKRNRTPR